jgi:hypothetical protein
MNDDQKSKRNRRRLAAMAISTVVVLVLAEVTIRFALPANLFLDRKKDCYWIMRIQVRQDEMRGKRPANVRLDDELGWTMRADRSNATESINSLGLRGSREVEYARKDGTKRAVVIGDSFTFGLGVPDDATYCARLEARVPGVEVINMGVNGYGTDQQFLQWQREGTKFDPDLVLIGVYVPDFHRNALSVREFPKPRFFVDGGKLVPSATSLPKARESLDEHRDSCGSGVRLLHALGYARRWLAGTEPDEPFEEKAALMHGILELLRDSTAKHGAKLGVLVIPDKSYRDYLDHERIERVIEGAAAELGIPLLNLTDELIERQRAHEGDPAYEPDYDPVHGHWSEAGHDAAAERITRFVRENELL